MPLSVKTEDKLEYKFYPAKLGEFRFKVQAPNDAHIALTSAPSETDHMLEVFIGGWQNTKSIIRKNKKKPEVAEIKTPGILDANELRGFWIKWNDNLVTVGKENESKPFLSYNNPDPLEITHVGICTSWGATGQWLIDVNTFTWVDAKNGVIPPGAMVAGEGSETLYVGRAQHEDALLPGKVSSEHGVCYVPWHGKEISKKEYQVLCGFDGKWVKVVGSNLPPNAVQGGVSEDGEPLYIGRITHMGTKIPGKVHPSHERLYIPYGGVEIAFEEFEILVD